MLAVTHIAGVSKWLDDGIVPRRMGTALFASVPSGAYPCKDGLVYLMVNRPLHWKALAEWIFEVTGGSAVLDPGVVVGCGYPVLPQHGSQLFGLRGVGLQTLVCMLQLVQHRCVAQLQAMRPVCLPGFCKRLRNMTCRCAT